jgi:hypothetical protein
MTRSLGEEAETFVTARKRAPNMSVEGPLVEAARKAARGNRGRFSRVEVVHALTEGLPAEQQRRRRKKLQAIISRLLALGFFVSTREAGVLRFRAMSAALPWEANLQHRRIAAVEHIRSRLSTMPALASSGQEYEARRADLRRTLLSRLRRLEALVNGNTGRQP